ncbi:unnamed protein product [Caenorhabditis auriculariae]|uniref:DNA polymerase alpha/delta/epsilon subunit B domain-containing protein n=1 Tax=Caenorhabditis auriculariae TaxID=2777116 RepID=A0A8S1HEZ8_9PELO|nr:unnamed protein product [Caenorhabditis auriculariae]
MAKRLITEDVRMETDEGTQKMTFKDDDWTARAPYRNCSAQFHLTEKDKRNAFDRQYHSFYEARIWATKQRILENADRFIGKGKYSFRSMNDIAPLEEVLVIGVIVKRLTQRPGVLKALINEERAAYANYDEEDEPNTDLRCLISDEDYLELESDQQIVKLAGNIKMDDCATGCCEEGDVFTVKQVVWPMQAPQPALSANRPSVNVAFTSGLELTGIINDDIKTISSFQMLSDWLKNDADMVNGNERLQNEVDRLVVLGQSIECRQAHDVYSVVKMLTLTKSEKKTSFQALSALDRLFCGLAEKVQVDVASGLGDPCPSLYPQQPIHRATLPRTAHTAKKVNLVTNPYEFELGGVRFLCTSGENVSDLLRMSLEWTGCDVLENILKWQHIAPTCPDTLDGFPMTHRDALFMESTPHVLICGNQPRAESRWVDLGEGRRCLCICLPKFSQSRMVCTLDLSKLEVNWHMFEHDF